LPSSGTTGRLKAPTTQLPNKKGGAGKIVVMLSSVAKPPPAVTQAIPMVAPPLKPPANIVSANSPQIVRQPPPLPPKQVTPATPSTPTAPGLRLSSTTFVKLPPKTVVPSLSSVSPKETQPEKNAPPLLPAKRSEPIPGAPKKPGAQHIPPIKLNEPSSDAATPAESIFLPSDKPGDKPEAAAKPPGWKSLEPGELNPPAENLQSLEVFARSQKILDKPATPVPEVKLSPHVAPPMLASETPAETKPALNPAPVSFAPSHPIHVAPPMLGKEAPLETPGEKLPPPHIPSEAGKSAVDAPQGPVKAPALISSEPPAPAPALLPPTSPVSKLIESRKKSEPSDVASTTPKNPQPPIAETKPALKPAVLPKRAMPLPKEPEAEPEPLPVAPVPLEAKKPEEPPAAKPEEKKIEAASPAEAPKAGEKKEGIVAASSIAAAALAAKTVEEKPVLQKIKPAAKPEPVPAAAPAIDTKKASLPPTRAERAKKRKIFSIIVFWVLVVPVTGFALVWGSFYFGRDTRLEGQIVPPQGMTVNNEVWIVSDFHDLASGIGEDLAAERTPIMREIQERRDHVQRVQADVASREERIRLIQDEIQASKGEIDSLVKQSRDATQQIWDGEGAQIDSEYESKLSDLKQAIANRAKSLNLKYQPDETYQSPEVWANAYRLALYEVPAGVDAVKEHQWLGDQMKQWRDFEKSLDDRKEQLREKAAQLKLAPAPKITDLNAKIEDLNQRIDSTQAEEVPLKTELQQAQVDLAQAQAADQGLDDKYYKQLYSLPVENITKHISLEPNGRFTWVEDESFAEGENERRYWIFSCATRADGRQYWALGRVSIEKNHKICLIIDPDNYLSTKAILRPDLSPEEQEQ